MARQAKLWTVFSRIGGWGELQYRPEDAHGDSQDNGIGQDSPQGLQQKLSVQGVGSRAGKFQDHYGHDIIKRDGSNDHQRSHGRTSVDILDKGDPQQGGAAAVSALDKFSPQGAVF